MKDSREMYFPGPQGMAPMGPQMGPGMGMGMTGPGFTGGMMPNISQLESKVASLERQVKRLDARVSRLENPYPTTGTFQGTTTGTYQPADMQEQPYNYPYQTSMQVM
jgi:hypothetical protein